MNKITLKSKIKRGDKLIKEISLREPSAGELRGLKLMDIASLDINAMSELTSRISQPSLTKEEFNQMNLSDITQIGEVINGFFEGK